MSIILARDAAAVEVLILQIIEASKDLTVELASSKTKAWMKFPDSKFPFFPVIGQLIQSVLCVFEVGESPWSVLGGKFSLSPIPGAKFVLLASPGLVPFPRYCIFINPHNSPVRYYHPFIITDETEAQKV